MTLIAIPLTVYVADNDARCTCRSLFLSIMLYSPFWTTTRPTSLFCPQLSLGKAYMELGWLPGLSVARPCRQPRWKRRLSGQEECSAVSKAGLRLRSDNWIWGSPSISFRLVTRSSASGGSKQLVYVQRLTRLGVTAQNVLPPVQTWLFEGNWECIQGILRVGSTSRQEKSRRRLMQRCRKQVGMAATTHSGGRSDGVEDEGSVVTSVAQQMGLLLESEPYMAAQAAAGLVTSIDQQGRAALLTALFSSASNEADGQFMQADANADGVLDRMEFASYVEAQSVRYGQSTKPLTPAQLYHLSTRAAIGMIGFGFTDNAIMIIAGDAIQSSIGGTLGLHTLLSAGLGNAVADLVGTAFRGYIERISSKFMPEVHFSSLQMQSKEAWWAETAGASVGVTIGCLLGLVPLLFLLRSDVSTNTVLAAAGGGSIGGGTNISLPTRDLVWCSNQSATVGTRMGHTVFATVGSCASEPSLTQGQGVIQRLGGPLVILTVTFAFAVKRLHQFTRRKHNSMGVDTTGL